MTERPFDLARTITAFEQAPAPIQEPALFKDGKITDPSARTAAQALYQCFTTANAKSAVETWLEWAQAATPKNRVRVYVAVWRHYLNQIRQK